MEGRVHHRCPPDHSDAGARDGGAPDASAQAGWQAPPPPAGAAAAFGGQLPLAQRYAQLLAGAGVQRGLIGPREAPRLWHRHLLNCAALAGLIPPRAGLAITDLGSGAGLPGIVVAMLRPEAEVTLLEPMARRVAFLTECIAELELGNVVICRARAQDMSGRSAADVVLARAVAPLASLAVLAAGLARPGGLVLAVKGAGARAELERARPVLARLGAADIELVRAGSDKVDPAATVVRFTTAAPRRAPASAAADLG